MSDSKVVKDVMIGISEFPRVSQGSSIKEAIKIASACFIEHKKYCEPLAVIVVDEDNRIVGTITLKDLLRGLEPRFLKPTTKAQVPEEDEAALAIIWDSLFEKEAKNLAKRTVKEFMTPAKYFVGPAEHITKAAYLMLHHDLILLPVLENKKKFIGLVRMLEIFAEISNALLKE